MRGFLILALVLTTAPLGGCLSREFSNFPIEAGEQIEMLDLFEVDLRYAGDLNRNSTRSEQDMNSLRADIAEIWARSVTRHEPAPPVVLERTAVVASSYVRPAPPPVVVPTKTEIERIDNSDIFIVRNPDGSITVTNKADQK